MIITNFKELYKLKSELAENQERECLHLHCSRCNGSGLDKRGFPCVHYISCRCPSCSPITM